MIKNGLTKNDKQNGLVKNDKNEKNGLIKMDW